ncbi:MAG: hypothetical protein ACUVV0_17020 [Anaerolineae bacterium]
MRHIIFPLILIMLCVVGVSACRPAEPAPTETQPPAKEEAPAAPSLTPAAPEGKTLLEERCTTCHSLDRIEKAKKTAEGWKSTVERMKGKGTKLNEAETEAVIEYLSATFKP